MFSFLKRPEDKNIIGDTGSDYFRRVSHAYKKRLAEGLSCVATENAQIAVQFLLKDAVRRQLPVLMVTGSEEMERIYAPLAEKFCHAASQLNADMDIVFLGMPADGRHSAFYKEAKAYSNIHMHDMVDAFLPHFMTVGRDAYYYCDGWNSKVDFNSDILAPFLQGMMVQPIIEAGFDIKTVKSVNRSALCRQLN